MFSVANSELLRRQGVLAIGVAHVCLCYLPGWDEILLNK